MLTDVPAPIFVVSPDAQHIDMPWIWRDEIGVVSQYKGADSLDIKADHVEYVKRFREVKEWESRIPKALFTGKLNKHRHILFDLASIRPDILDANWTCCEHTPETYPWNPLSKMTPEYNVDEVSKLHDESVRLGTKGKAEDIGFYHNIMSTYTAGSFAKAGDYKYVVVVQGLVATASRLAQLISLSGCVILLQETTMVRLVNRMIIILCYTLV